MTTSSVRRTIFRRRMMGRLRRPNASNANGQKRATTIVLPAYRVRRMQRAETAAMRSESFGRGGRRSSPDSLTVQPPTVSSPRLAGSASFWPSQGRALFDCCGKLKRPIIAAAQPEVSKPFRRYSASSASRGVSASGSMSATARSSAEGSGVAGAGAPKSPSCGDCMGPRLRDA